MNEDLPDIFRWETIKEVGPDTLYFAEPVVGVAVEIELVSGNQIKAFRANDGLFYFCHGLAFGGANAPPAQQAAQAVENDALKAALAGKLGTTSQLVDTTIQSVQKIATELRPGTLDKLGLAAALEQEARDFAQRAGLRYTCELAAAPLDLDDRTATGIFRIFQEALTNIARHAHATEFRFRLVRDHAGVQLEVGDNGQGITAAQLAEAKSLGLLGMRERANLLGGRLDIQGRSGVGTTVTLTVPLPP